MLNAQNFAFIGCRLIAIFHLSNVVLMLVRLLLQATVVEFSKFFEQGLDFSTSWVWSADFIMTSLFTFVLFWLTSHWLSKKILQNSEAGEVESNWSYVNMLSMAISLIGIYIIAIKIPHIVGNFLKVWDIGINFIFLFHNFLEVAVGLACVLASRRIARLITGNRLQSQGSGA